jgi:hypothetical protein
MERDDDYKKRATARDVDEPAEDTEPSEVSPLVSLWRSALDAVEAASMRAEELKEREVEAVRPGAVWRRRTLLGAAIVAMALGGCVVVEDDGDSTLTVSNRSSYWIEELHLANVNDPSWGPDLVDGALAPGEDAIIVDIECGRYDVMVVDETGVECELSNLELCFDAGQWVIDDLTLDICAFGG